MKRSNAIECLESRVHFAIGWTMLIPGQNTDALAQTIMIYGDGAADAISVAATPASAQSSFPWNYTCVQLALTWNAADLRVFGYGGNDTITLKSCQGGTVSGNTGDDTVTLIDCQYVNVYALTNSDGSYPNRPFDGADTLELRDSLHCALEGWDGVDTFRTSGDCRYSGLSGGPGNDDFAVGGIFSNSSIYCGADNDIVTGSGDWDKSKVWGGDGNDRIDLRGCSGFINLYGEGGDDTMWGGSSGNDFYGGTGRDRMIGGVGDDGFYAVDGYWDTISGGEHVDGDWAEVDFPNPDGTDLDWLSAVEFVRYN